MRSNSRGTSGFDSLASAIFASIVPLCLPQDPEPCERKSMAYHFKNMILEGGGVKGIAHVGVVEELGKRGITDDMIRVGDTSAGAINAVVVGLNYSLDETRTLLWGLNFKKCREDSWGRSPRQRAIDRDLPGVRGRLPFSATRSARLSRQRRGTASRPSPISKPSESSGSLGPLFSWGRISQNENCG
jgi:hypothetical protein